VVDRPFGPSITFYVDSYSVLILHIFDLQWNAIGRHSLWPLIAWHNSNCLNSLFEYLLSPENSELRPSTNLDISSAITERGVKLKVTTDRIYLNILIHVTTIFRILEPHNSKFNGSRLFIPLQRPVIF
jgi:hypothetical protein